MTATNAETGPRHHAAKVGEMVDELDYGDFRREKGDDHDNQQREDNEARSQPG